ncbi:hypothetical protein CQA66_08210 [Helicobacter aurati]|uniref:Uncharacterized protein n=1 Tax=Helicobacter aurati TaxID=137778 RepID=A0A3D8J0S8_9HELI|nr:hypothetical protein [Helicobacter aurati]RDU70381.1 hypothetical protein CQA66_08210 [Helicobacter aurati]
MKFSSEKASNKQKQLLEVLSNHCCNVFAPEGDKILIRFYGYKAKQIKSILEEYSIKVDKVRKYDDMEVIY